MWTFDDEYYSIIKPGVGERKKVLLSSFDGMSRRFPTHHLFFNTTENEQNNVGGLWGRITLGYDVGVSTTRDDVINLEFLIFTYWNLETLLVNRSTYPSHAFAMTRHSREGEGSGTVAHAIQCLAFGRRGSGIAAHIIPKFFNAP